MRVLLHDAVFAPGVSSPDDLDELVLLGLKGRHRFAFADPSAPTPCVDAWLAARGWSARWQAVGGIAARAGARNPLVHAVEVVPPDRIDRDRRVPRLDVSTAVRVLRQPLHIMLENGRNDGRLLRALAALDARVAEFDRLVEEGVCELVNGGGLPEMYKQLEASTRDPLDHLRRFAIFDSDATSPGRPERVAEEVEELCGVHRVGRHMLRRRAAENYLPPPCLTRWGDRQSDRLMRRVRAWRRLNTAQRHHFHMREGLAKDERNFDALERRKDVSTGVDLFADLEDGARTILAGGFGREVRDLFDGDLPEWEGWMRDDDQADEVRTLFRELLSRL